MFEKIFIAGFVSIIAVLLLVLLVLVPQGTPLDFTYIDRINESTLTEEKATCLEYNGMFISNIELYEAFLETCEINADANYNSEYFKNNVLICYFYDGAIGSEPKSFRNDFFTVEDHEIITIKNRRGNEEEVVWRIYLLEMKQDDVSTSDIHFE